MSLPHRELERIALATLSALGVPAGSRSWARVQTVVFYLKLWLRLWADPSAKPEPFDPLPEPEPEPEPRAFLQ